MLMNKIWQGREFSRIQNWKVRDFVTDAVKDILAARKAQAMRRHLASMGFCQDFSSNECLKMTCYQKTHEDVRTLLSVALSPVPAY